MDEILWIFFSADSDDFDYFDDLLLIASGRGHTKIVKLLVEKEIIQCYDCPLTALHKAFITAIEAGHTSVVEFLLKRIEHSQEDLAFKRACECGNEEVELLLKDSRLNLSFDDCNYAIRRARDDGNTRLLEVLFSDSRIREEDTYSLMQGVKRKR